MTHDLTALLYHLRFPLSRKVISEPLSSEIIINKYHILVYRYCCLVTKSCPTLRPHELYVARQAPLSVGLSRQGYWSGLPFPSPRGSSWPRDLTCVSCIDWWFFFFFNTEPPVSFKHDQLSWQSQPQMSMTVKSVSPKWNTVIYPHLHVRTILPPPSLQVVVIEMPHSSWHLADTQEIRTQQSLFPSFSTVHPSPPLQCSAGQALILQMKKLWYISTRTQLLPGHFLINCKY